MLAVRIHLNPAVVRSGASLDVSVGRHLARHGIRTPIEAKEYRAARPSRTPCSLVAMSDVEELSCPTCGAPVKTSGGPVRMERVTDSGGDSHTTAYSSERSKCASCGAQLERLVSPHAAWRVTAD